MTPDNLRESIAATFNFMPWYMKAFYFVIAAGQLACAVCLPLIVLKLWIGSNVQAPKGVSVPVPRRVQESQDRREALSKIRDETRQEVQQQESGGYVGPSATDEAAEAKLDDDSRFLPRS